VNERARSLEHASTNIAPRWGANYRTGVLRASTNIAPRWGATHGGPASTNIAPRWGAEPPTGPASTNIAPLGCGASDGLCYYKHCTPLGCGASDGACFALLQTLHPVGVCPRTPRSVERTRFHGSINKKGSVSQPETEPFLFLILLLTSLETAHAASRRHLRSFLLLLRHFRNQRFGSQQQPGD